MIKLSKLAIAIASVGMALSSTNAFAHSAGDWIVRVGAANVDPDSGSDPLTASSLTAPGASTALSGTNVTVDDNMQLGLTFTYMLSDHLGLELLAATPFEHTASLAGLGTSSLEAVTTKHLPPTLSVQYFPMSPDSVIQPYIGAGLNYTIFFDEKVGSDVKSAFGDGDVTLEDSLGLAFELGVDLELTETLHLNASVWKIDIDTTAEIRLPDADLLLETDIDIDPVVYMVGLGFKF